MEKTDESNRYEHKKEASESTCSSDRTGTTDGAGTESDWWYNLILLVEDRTGTDEMKTRQLIRWVSTMPSQMHLFDSINTKDFLRLTNE